MIMMTWDMLKYEEEHKEQYTQRDKAHKSNRLFTVTTNRSNFSHFILSYSQVQNVIVI